MYIPIEYIKPKKCEILVFLSVLSVHFFYIPENVAAMLLFFFNLSQKDT